MDIYSGKYIRLKKIVGIFSHRNIKTQGITTAETAIIKLDDLY